MVTVTERHTKGQGLSMLWEALAYAWGATTSGKMWKAEKARYDVQGWLRLVEVTVGDNGWHVHVHALVFTLGTSHWSPEDLGPLMFARWRKALKRKGLEAPVANLGGLHVKVMGGDAGSLGDYFTKSVYRYDETAGERAGLEIARGDLKDARHGNRTPFRVLADLVRNGEASDLALWHEYERASLDRRQLTWSRGLRAALLGDLVEQSDAEIAEAEQGGAVLLVIDAESWKQAVRIPGEKARICGLAESDDTGDNLRAYLRSMGWRWQEAEAWASSDDTRKGLPAKAFLAR